MHSNDMPARLHANVFAVGSLALCLHGEMLAFILTGSDVIKSDGEASSGGLCVLYETAYDYKL